MTIQINNIRYGQEGASLKELLFPDDCLRLEIHKDLDDEFLLFKSQYRYYDISVEEIDYMIKLLNLYKENQTYISMCVDGLNKSISDELDEEYAQYKRGSSKRNTEKIKKAGYVYIAKCTKTLTYKIGCTTRDEPSKRILELKSTNPFIEEIAIFFVNDILEEKEWHKRFEDKNISGEWFYLDQEDIDEMKDYYKTQR